MPGIDGSVFALTVFEDDGGPRLYAGGFTDDLDPLPAIVCTPPSGSFFSRGATTMDCTATDAAGNQATCQFQVLVQRKTRPR